MPKPVVHGESIRPIAEGTPIVRARDLQLKTPLGCPSSGVTLDITQGQVFAICGSHGSGKTALLLTLAGRMIPTKGKLEVLGYAIPRHMSKVQRRVGLGIFEGLNDVHEAQQVRRAIAAEFELHGRKATRDALENFLCDWHLDSVADRRVNELTRPMMVRLGVALAWTGHPDIIVLDDIESGMTKSQSIEIMERLALQACKRNVTIVVGVLERDLAAMTDDALLLGDELVGDGKEPVDSITREPEPVAEPVAESIAEPATGDAAGASHAFIVTTPQDASQATSLQPEAREA